MGQKLVLKFRHMGSDFARVNILVSFSVNLVVLTSFLLPASAYASLTCNAIIRFSCEVEAAEQVSGNSQTIALLEAHTSPVSNNTSEEEKSRIVSGNSLAFETELSEEAKMDARPEGSDQISIYVVRKGDTLPAIAKMFGVTVNTIRWGNDIKGNTITPGQTLVILPISGVQHVVKKGDTLESITKLHKGDLDEVLQYNNLTKNSKLAVGDVITVPDGEIVATPSPKPSSSRGGSSSPTYNGYYMRPITGGVRTQGIHGHNGVDLAAGYGSNILASADGQVIISRNSGYNGGYGSYVVIKHANGTQTLYAHLSGTAVGVGETVKQGQVIGYMGSTGKSTGTHLHFEIRGARNPF